MNYRIVKMNNKTVKKILFAKDMVCDIIEKTCKWVFIKNGNTTYKAWIQYIYIHTTWIGTQYIQCRGICSYSTQYRSRKLCILLPHHWKRQWLSQVFRLQLLLRAVARPPFLLCWFWKTLQQRAYQCQSKMHSKKKLFNEIAD